jgi:hypothetical protein
VAVAWPLRARAQRPAIPTIGYLTLASRTGELVAAFRQGLNEAGYIEGRVRANVVRSLDVCCWLCHHRAILSAGPWSYDLPVRTFGPRMVCTRCGIIGAGARPNWQEQPPRETLTGVQRR